MSEIKWLSDANGNCCSVQYFGSEEAAQRALDSLKNCRNCTNCSDCSGCSRCSDCSGCSRCSDCSGCSRCSDCSDCSRCSDCSGCSRCSDCSDCSRCSGCSRCSDCSGCSDCSDCSDCSGCSGCSHIAWLVAKENIQAVPRTDARPPGAPPVPVIVNIHQKMLDAVSQPNALDMGTWHCGTTHCRAGWAVTLAGEEGKALEEFFGTEQAAMQIYKASGSPINPARFYDDNASAMADMKRLAEDEAAKVSA